MLRTRFLLEVLGPLKKRQLGIGMPRIMSQWADNTFWHLLVRAAGRNLSQSWSCCDSSRSILGSTQRVKETCRKHAAQDVCACVCVQLDG